MENNINVHCNRHGVKKGYTSVNASYKTTCNEKKLGP